MVKKRKTKAEYKKEAIEKDAILKGIVFIGGVMLISIISMHLMADEIVHKFKNPSFSGVGTSSHYLTIENQEFNRKADIVAEIKALKEQQERDAENTTLARFLRNLESRIYAQLSRQLVDQLFGETPSDNGILEFMGTTIEYSVSADGLMITLKITNQDGEITEITLPVGSFTF